MPGFQRLIDQLQAYKKKYYLNQLLRGSIISVLLLLVAYLVFSSLEYSLRFSSPMRAVLFFAFLALLIGMVGTFVVLPILRLLDNRRQLSSEEAAQQIGTYFPEVGDKLLNTLQLSGLSADQNALIQASIEQRSQELGVFTFTDAIPLSQNQRYLKYLSIPFSVAILLWIFFPQLLRDGSTRIIQYQQDFVPVAPFQFQVTNNSLTAFRNEDFKLSLALTGSALPDAVYMEANGRRLKMIATGGGQFEHTFSKIQQDIDFRFEAAGFSSAKNSISVVNRPNLKNFNVRLDYPNYLGKSSDRLANVGNLQVPQGTRITWQFNTLDADSLQLSFESQSENLILQPSGNQLFEYQNSFLETEQYGITLFNEFSANREEISYLLDVIPDEYPTISLDQFQDTTLYQYVILGGNIADDHGLTELLLRYRITEAGQEPIERFETVSLNLNTTQISQSYYERWAVDTFNLEEGDKLEYYLQVFDNDGVNGRKATRTGQYTFALPSTEEIEENLDRIAQQTEGQLDKTLQQAQQLREKLKENQERLQGKNNLDWRDQNQLQQMLEQREQLEEAIQQMQEQLKENNLQQSTFNEPSPELQQKMENLQELLDEVLDPETKAMWEELKRLLEEQADKEQIQDMVEDLNRSEKNLEEELDRTLELFKRFQAEMQLENALDKLNELQEQQEELSEETGDENSETDDSSSENEGDQENQESGDEQSDSESNEENQNSDSQDNSESEEGSEEDSKESEGDEQSQGEENNPSDNQEDSSNEDEDSESQESESSESDQQNGQESTPKSDEQLRQEQEQLQKDFEEVQEELDKFRKMNQDLDRPNPVQDTFDEEQEIQKQQQNSEQQLQQGQRQQSQQSQQNATQQMQQMQDKLEQTQGGMSMQQMQENLDNLRDIVDNLVKLSFNQEELMQDFREVQLRDPRIVELSQRQLKLADDSEIIEDSLLSLASRVFQIQSFVTRELNSMNDHMDKTVEDLRDRNFNQALSEQQFAMTSMNNLALLLDDVLEQMQQQMAQAMGMGSGSGSGQGQDQSDGSGGDIGKLQEQLNQQIQDLKQSGKSGRELSEELAKLAAEQERLRQAMKRLQQMSNGTPGGEQLGGELSEIMQQMEETETDLVNKRLTEELIERQKQMTTRLLEAEKALREQDMEEEREGERASAYDRLVPEAFEEYIRAKEKEIELLKSVPLQLNPYYKKEVSDYFKRLNDN